MSWENEHQEAWERENKRAAQEKHDEKYWSEIEDGVATKTPGSHSKPSAVIDPLLQGWDSLSFEEKLQKLKERFEKS